MPYLEVNQGNQEEVEVIEEVTVPNLVGLSIKEAEKTVKELGLKISFENILNNTEENKESLDKENTIIKEQTPTEGIKINKGNKIFVKY
ncbi:MAG: PASTA domain-containing protein [Clostridia bacterium]|nr:PASTA domain-containing protein [Clostridia bacterium]